MDVGEVDALCAALHKRQTGAQDPLPLLEGPARELSLAIDAAVRRRDEECAALRRFTADAAHQLRTPLAVLSARIDAPAAHWNEDQLRGDLQWMGRLIDQLLTASRTAIASVDPSATFDLRALATEVVSALAPLAIYRGRALALAGRDSHERVCGNHALAFEAVSNLVENALDHGPEGSTITVATAGRGTLEVRDRGAGVPAEEQDRIFTRFTQGGRPTEGGAGLGLSIVSEVMAKHGGSVCYRDRRGGGATFVLRFSRPRSSGARQESTTPSDGAVGKGRWS